jgi:hypothetical protein
MARPTDPLESTRRRLEGRLEHLEAAPGEYEAHAGRPTAEWSRADVASLLALEVRASAAEQALRRLLRGSDVPAFEGALLFRFARARAAFLEAQWGRLTGAMQPPEHARACLALLMALPDVTEDPRPIYERLESPRFSWDGPTRLACRLSLAGLLVGERFVPAARYLNVGVRLEPGGPRGLPDRTFVDGLELPYRDQAPVRAAIELLHELGASAAPTADSWVIGGNESRGAWAFFTHEGAFVLEVPAAWMPLSAAGVARVLASAPPGRVTQRLRDERARVIPFVELRAGLRRLPRGAVQLVARDPVLDVTLPPGDADRLAALIER